MVKLDKGDFVGREALDADQGRAARPQARRLRGDRARHRPPRLSAPRHVEASEVGVCTSGSPGPTVGKNIGLGYLPAAMTAIGTKFLVDCRGKNVEAVVVKTPFYKRASPLAEDPASTSMSDNVPADLGTRRTTSGRRPSGAEVTVGITAFAVEQLGDITLVNLDVKVGRHRHRRQGVRDDRERQDAERSLRADQRQDRRG